MASNRFDNTDMVSGAAQLEVSPKIYPDNSVLFDTDFSTGFEGWTPNFSGLQNGGMWGTLSLSPLSQTGRYSLMLAVADGKTSTDPWGNCMALKRGTTFKDGGIFNFDMWLDFGNPDAVTRSPAGLIIGIDHQKVDKSLQLRRFLQVRYNNYNGDTNPRYWEVYEDNGAGGFKWTKIPDSEMDLPWNENKVTFVYMRLVVDLSTMKFVFFQVYDKVFDLSGFTPFIDSYHGFFDGGLNCCVQIFNQSDATYTGGAGGQVRIDRARGYFL